MLQQHKLLGHGCSSIEITAKTHKATGENNILKSHLIVGASKGLTTPLGELLSDLVELISRMREESDEAQSTED